VSNPIPEYLSKQLLSPSITGVEIKWFRQNGSQTIQFPDQQSNGIEPLGILL
jgi:hypothetical protein